MAERIVGNDKITITEAPQLPDYSIDEELVAFQTEYMQDLLLRNNLPHIRVQREPELREVSQWDNQLTFGVRGMHEETVALFASSELESSNDEMPVDTILLTHGSTQGSVLRDSETNQPAANFFFVIENGVVKPVIPSQPVPIDLILQSYSFSPYRDLDSQFVIADDVTHDTLCYKYIGKPLMQKFGIPTPEGFVAKKDIDYNVLLEDLINDGATEIVVKNAAGHRSEGLRMFDVEKDGIEKIQRHLKRFLRTVGAAVVERRVRAADIPFTPHDNIDWNIRSLLLLTENEPEFLGAFIRYQKRSNKPVSISTGAHIMPINERSPMHQVATVQFSKEVASIFSDIIKKLDGNPQGIIGLDIMWEDLEEGKVLLHILESNGWVVGGFNELCQMSARPIDAIATRMIPALRSRLTANHEQRNHSGTYESLPVGGNEKKFLDFYELSKQAMENPSSDISVKVVNQ